MAFRFFHKHSRKILIVATSAIIFTMVTFTIPQALEAFTGSAGGSGAQTFLKFTTASGKPVEISRDDYFLMSLEVPGLVGLLYSAQIGLPHGVIGAKDLPVAHAILLAEAEEVGIEVPEAAVDAWYQGIVEWYGQVNQGRPVTVGDFDNLLRRANLTKQSLRVRLAEARKIDFYRSTLTGPSIVNPAHIERVFQVHNMLVSLDYLDFPVARYRELLEATPPSEEELSAYFANLSPAIVNSKFSTPERYRLDLALLSYDSMDWDQVPDALMADFVAPTDADLFQRFQGDPVRYGTVENAESAADLTDEVRAKLDRDFRAKHLLTRMADRYREFVALQGADQPVDDSDPDTSNGAQGGQDPDEATDPAADPAAEEAAGATLGAVDDAAAQAARKAALEAAQLAEFERLCNVFGFEYQRSPETQRTELRNLDPPGDPTLQYLVVGLASGGEVQTVEAASERGVGYVVRLAEKKPFGTKSFEEARDDVLTHWLDETAKERAREAADEFRAAVRERAVAALPPERIAGVQADRAEKLAKIDADTSLEENVKKARRDAIEREYFSHISGFLGTSEGPLFEEVAAAQGLELKKIDFFRRSIGQTPHFNSRFEGAERFLMRQYNRAGQTPMLLGYAKDMVGEVLVDFADGTAYIARITGQKPPAVDTMTPKDRNQAELESSRDVNSLQQEVPYYSPFSIEALIRINQPMVILRKPPPDEDAPSS